MVSKKQQPDPKEANLSSQQMEAAIIKLDRRIDELEKFDVNSVNEEYDPRISALEQSLDTLLVNIFGSNTVEYLKYRLYITNIDTAPRSYVDQTSISEIREGIRHGIDTAKTHLKEIKKLFSEELADSGHSSAGKTLKAYDGLELHPSIERQVGQLFRDGHYANAVEDAVKALNALVRLNSGVDDKDGSQLMEYVFNSKSPILKFNSLSDQSDIDEQRGFMMMFSGSVVGFRNPRAHKIIKDDPEKALEFIAFISLLAKLADAAKK